MELCQDFDSIRVLSVAIYMLLCLLNLSYEQCDQLLADLRLLGIKRCHEWVDTIIDEEDLCVVLRDQRGCHKHVSFYDGYPELEAEAKAFAFNGASSKNGLNY